MRTTGPSWVPTSSQREGVARSSPFADYASISVLIPRSTVLIHSSRFFRSVLDSSNHSQPDFWAASSLFAGESPASVSVDWMFLTGHFRLGPHWARIIHCWHFPISTFGRPVDSGSRNHEIGSGPVKGFTLSRCTVMGFARLDLWITTLTGVGVAMIRKGPSNLRCHLSCFPTYFPRLK